MHFALTPSSYLGSISLNATIRSISLKKSTRKYTWLWKQLPLIASDGQLSVSLAIAWGLTGPREWICLKGQVESLLLSGPGIQDRAFEVTLRRGMNGHFRSVHRVGVCITWRSTLVLSACSLRSAVVDWLSRSLSKERVSRSIFAGGWSFQYGVSEVPLRNTWAGNVRRSCNTSPKDAPQKKEWYSGDRAWN